MIKDVICLKWQADLSYEKIAATLNISKGAVTKYVGLAHAAGVDSETVRDWSEQRLTSALLPKAKARHPSAHEQLPASHWTHLQWTPAKLSAWGERVGAATAAVVRWRAEHRLHPEQGYLSCL